MRIRTIKPEFWTDKLVGEWDVFTRLLFIGMWSLADDHGRGNANPVRIAAELFAYDLSRDPRETLANITRGIEKLSGGCRIKLYEVGSESFFEIVHWKKHQRVDKPGNSRVPAPCEANAKTIRDTLATPSRESCDRNRGTEEQRNRGTEEVGTGEVGAEESSSLRSEESECSPPTTASQAKPKRKERAAPLKHSPTLTEWKAHCAEELSWTDAAAVEAAWAHYEAVGWVQGRKSQPIRNWHAVALASRTRSRAWAKEKRERDQRGPSSRGDEPPPLPMAPEPDTPWTPTPVIHHEVRKRESYWPDEEIPGA